MIGQREVAKVFAAALASAKRRDDWAQVARNFPCEVAGVACNLHFRAQLIWQRKSTAARVSGECFVYLSNASESGLAGGSGWVSFAFSEPSIESAWHLFAVAFEEAMRELRATPEFQALVEQAQLAADLAPPKPSAEARSRFRL